LNNANSYLDRQRISNDSFETNIERFSLDELLEETTGMFKIQAKNKKIALQ